MKTKGNILICPLEWGLGHAARMIPIARELLKMGFNVIIGAGDEHLSFFRNEIPGIQCITLKGFRTRYSRLLPQYLYLLLMIPSLVYHAIREHQLLKKAISRHNISLVISDNRFGLWNRNITSVYVTHMPRIPFPRFFRFLEFTGILLHRAVIRKYTFCYIPDLPGPINLSGRLSHGMHLPSNVRYIGILSRFAGKDNNPGEKILPGSHSTVILSGPEPQRTILAEKLGVILRNNGKKYVFLEGKLSGLGETHRVDGNIYSFNHLTTDAMKKVMTESEMIICRSGYSTLMDLVSLNLSAVIIPTPGQTEQEYLAHYLENKGWFRTVSQREAEKVGTMSPNHISLPPAMVSQSRELLEKALAELSDKVHKNE